MTEAGTHRASLGAAIQALALSVERKKLVDHHIVRAVLIPLGLMLIEGEQAAPEIARIQEIARRVQSKWVRALASELDLATSEHVQSADPRFLSHPSYDFDYTLLARERLEARLVAAEALGHPPRAELLARMRRADALLAPYLRSRESGESAN